jgi:hypothetical protein
MQCLVKSNWQNSTPNYNETTAYCRTQTQVTELKDTNTIPLPPPCFMTYDTFIRFKGLADFQYLAPQIPDLLDGLRGREILDIETALHLPPPAFCRIDHPFDYQYRTDPVSKDRTSQTNEQ